MREALTTYEAADRAARRRRRSADALDGLCHHDRLSVRRTNQIDNLVYPFFFPRRARRMTELADWQARAAARRGAGPPRFAVLSADGRGPARAISRSDHRRRGADRRRGDPPARQGAREAGGQLLCRAGIGRDPARPARVPVAFKLADPAPGGARAPAATRAAPPRPAAARRLRNERASISRPGRSSR